MTPKGHLRIMNFSVSLYFHSEFSLLKLYMPEWPDHPKSIKVAWKIGKQSMEYHIPLKSNFDTNCKSW